jgi:hypothetical protein
MLTMRLIERSIQSYWVIVRKHPKSKSLILTLPLIPKPLGNRSAEGFRRLMGREE